MPVPRPLAGCRRRRSSFDGDPFFSLHLSLGSTGFHRLPRYYEEIRLLQGHRLVVVASFRPTACAEPCRPPRVRCTWMYCRSRPQYRSDLGWIWGVAFLGTLTRSARPVRGLHSRSVLQPAFRLLPHTSSRRVQLPSACGCYQLAPQRTSTSYPGPMPGTPRTRSAPPPAVARRRAILDRELRAASRRQSGSGRRNGPRSNKETDLKKGTRDAKKIGVRVKNRLTKKSPYKGVQDRWELRRWTSRGAGRFCPPYRARAGRAEIVATSESNPVRFGMIHAN